MFVSYCWKDRGHVDELCDRLREAGETYWLDSERLDLDEPVGPQIAEAVAMSTGLILVDSRASRGSDWVAFELQAARWSGKAVRACQPGVVRPRRPVAQPWKRPAGPNTS
jgi:TIR domain